MDFQARLAALLIWKKDQVMFDILFMPENLPFAVALAMPLFLGLLEGVGRLPGFAVSDLQDNLVPEADMKAIDDIKIIQLDGLNGATSSMVNGEAVSAGSGGGINKPGQRPFGALAASTPDLPDTEHLMTRQRVYVAGTVAGFSLGCS